MESCVIHIRVLHIEKKKEEKKEAEEEVENKNNPCRVFFLYFFFIEEDNMPAICKTCSTNIHRGGKRTRDLIEQI